MKTFTDDEMRQRLSGAKAYSVVILKQGPSFGDDTTPTIVWEHGRRNFGLRDDGVLPLVLPCRNPGIVVHDRGGVLECRVEHPDAAYIRPVGEGVFTYQVHACRGFPGDALP